MKKEVKEVIKLSRVLSPPTAYYVAGIQRTRDIVSKFMNKPSFIDKLK
jgi:hypothetical protein|tara:strand:+ start:651 stop:794 length:144 start_codon:yes stop_codon:yes gene_type:complete